ncbi:hypothetical protein BGX29_007208 [Mortierella sp. GBA35]|nr:hypothetical protein BGX29_007208 [Mortierella sp. GBA35]
MTAPLAWPTRDTRHAGILDIGLIGGAIYDPDLNSWKFARESEEFRYRSCSPLTQMLPRERPWEPRPANNWRHQDWKYNKEFSRFRSINPVLTENMVYLNSSKQPSEWLPDSVVKDTLAESAYEDFALSVYDPYQGNVCAVGRFIGLPVVATPGGSTGTDLSIILAQHKPQQQPPFNLLRPKSTLLSFTSPILQIAAPTLDSNDTTDEQLLVRTREFVTIVAAPAKIPQAISRMEPDFVQILGRIPTKPRNCIDNTIHATISPYASNTYALVGDQGRVAIWTRQDSDYNPIATDTRSQDTARSIRIIRKQDGTSDEQEDRWRRCIWSAHPEQLIVTSRTNMELVDYRGPRATTSLFQLRQGETIQALQENDVSSFTPFHTYIATSHQIACVDQRFPKRPLISTAHQMGRLMPCGLKTMDLVSDESRYTTVLTWDMRNAGITAYNFYQSSNGTDSEPPAMKGGAQEFPSFHTHAQYTNTSELRNPLKRWEFKVALGDRLPQAIKPPLMGLAVLPASVLSADDKDDDDDDEEQDSRALVKQSVPTFSLLQYAVTGAVYAQEIEVVNKQEFGLGSSSDQVLTSGNVLALSVAKGQSQEDVTAELELIDRIVEAARGSVAPWKRGAKELQARADVPVITQPEVRDHDEFDLQDLMKNLKLYLLMDRESSREDVDVESKVTQAMDFIGSSDTPVSMYDILYAIKCANLPITARSAISQQVQNNIELDPFVTSPGKFTITRKVIRTWPGLDRDISTVLRDQGAATVEAIQSYLEQLYPFPEPCVLDSDNDNDAAAGPSTTPGDRHVDESGSTDGREEQTQVWPSQESRNIRSSAIRRLAQELALTTTVIVRTMEPEDSSEPTTTTTAASTNAEIRFKYLFQDTKNGSIQPPAIKLSVRAKGVLDEWVSGEDIMDFTYRPSSDLEESGDEADGTEGVSGSTTAKQKELEERLLQKRRQREKRENKLRSSRMQDSSYNINAKGSASQPAGIVTEESSSFFSSMRYADEDGMFSTPTIVAASQVQKSAVLRRNAMFSASQPAFLGRTSTTTATASNNQAKVKKEELSPVVSKSQPPLLFTTESKSGRQNKQEPADGGRRGGVWAPSSMPGYRLSQVEGQSSSQSQSQGVKPESQEMFAASMPVPGPFGTKRFKGAPTDPRTKPKKKNRTQGF